ncbi:hypothetical protein [Sphaerisporangium fuscum]|uniref:hypothetical protein n=1 Tax=Sphaerisporangium fuscum TaxID=2835868 RepID=UPI001BDD7FA5|nr:hypothetical protein [Sphaerisporangium fuscum]
MKATTCGRRIGAATGVAGLAMVVLTAPALAAPAAAAHVRGPAVVQAGKAGAGDICLYSRRDYKGASWCWNPGNGYVDVPPALHDNVGSFQADADGCFINWINVPENRKETRVVRKGDYRRVYDNDFGGKIDAVAPSC